MDQALGDLARVEADASLFQPDAFDARVAAVDQLDLILEALRHVGPGTRRARRRAAALRERLEEANRRYASALRADLQDGRWDPAALRAELDRHTSYNQAPGALHLELEPLDQLLEMILGLDRFQGEPEIAHADYVHLEDSPARVILDLVDHVPMTSQDSFCDLGAGLGRVAILVHWLTGADAEGIEVQPAYAAFARRLADEFGLERVRFQQSDAAEADLSHGTVFYLFTPFKGRTLARVWDRLRGEADGRPITICTYGAVSLSAARQPWLAPAGGEPPHEFALALWRAG